MENVVPSCWELKERIFEEFPLGKPCLREREGGEGTVKSGLARKLAEDSVMGSLIKDVS
jgi:hypothetical protein